MFIRSEKERVPFKKSVTINIYHCEVCNKETRLRVNWHGPKPNGGFKCVHCDNVMGF